MPHRDLTSSRQGSQAARADMSTVLRGRAWCLQLHLNKPKAMRVIHAECEHNML